MHLIIIGIIGLNNSFNLYNGSTNPTYTPAAAVPGTPPSGAGKVSMVTYFINNSGHIYVNVVNDWQAHPAP